MRTENMLAFTPFNIFLEAGASLPPAWGGCTRVRSCCSYFFFFENKNIIKLSFLGIVVCI
jgi:hypothetical protein